MLDPWIEDDTVFELDIEDDAGRLQELEQLLERWNPFGVEGWSVPAPRVE